MLWLLPLALVITWDVDAAVGNAWLLWQVPEYKYLTLCKWIKHTLMQKCEGFCCWFSSVLYHIADDAFEGFPGKQRELTHYIISLKCLFPLALSALFLSNKFCNTALTVLFFIKNKLCTQYKGSSPSTGIPLLWCDVTQFFIIVCAPCSHTVHQYLGHSPTNTVVTS